MKPSRRSTSRALFAALAAAGLACAAHAQTPRITCQLSRVFLPSGFPVLVFVGDHAQVVLSVTVSPPIGTQISYPAPPGPGVGTVVGLAELWFDLVACDTIIGQWTLAGTGFQGSTGTTWGIRTGWALGPAGTPQPNGSILDCIVGQFPASASQINPLNPVAEIWRARWDPGSFESGRRMRLTLYPRSARILVRYGPGSGDFTSIAAAVDPVWTDFLIDPGPPPPCYAAVQTQPQSITVPSGSPATFHAAGIWWNPTPTCPAHTYRWRRDCQPLTDVGRISGSSTDTLHITGVTFADVGQYDVVVSGRQSDPATLTVLCTANCDNSTAPPVLNAADFGCFLNRFAAGDSRANCDGSTAPPVLSIADFSCFLNQFAAGCP